jgi:hypothetical protein
MRARFLALLAASAALGGCAYGYGSPYGGMSVGVSSGYYGGYGGYGGYSSYGSPYGYIGTAYGVPYGYGYQPYYGWYDNYYYPGTGIYVYDSYRRPHAMSDSQKRYWTERQQRVTSPTTTTTTTRDRRTARRERPALRENWSAFKTKAATTTSSDRRAKRDRTRD